MENRVGVTCAILLLSCVQIQAQFGMGMGMGAMGMGGHQQGQFSSMAAMMGFQSCDPFAPPPPPPRRGGARGGRPGAGGAGAAGGGGARQGMAQRQRSPALSLTNMMFGMSMDVPDAPDFPAMPMRGAGGRMTWTGCFCQSPEFGMGSGDCMGAFTGQLRHDPCMQMGLCCTCDFGWKRR